MIRYIFHSITLFALLVFPVLPGLCECVEVPAKDHGCCHEESNETPQKHPCPDEPHFCIHNSQHVEIVVQAAPGDSFESDCTLEKSSDFLICADSKLLTAVLLTAQGFQLESSFYDNSILLPPVRGPPVTPL